MTSGRPYSIRVFLPAGDPDGIRVVEKSGWNGSGIVVPRSLFADARQRKELARTGVYVLIGPPEDSGLARVYVGEGDPIRPRLEQHALRKDFWTSLVAFSSKDENLNKAHVQHIESRLVALATKAKRCVLDNGNVPQPPSLSEADAADADGFLAEMLLCLPVLGVSMFADAEERTTGTAFLLRGKQIQADGLESPQGFIIRNGSRAVGAEVPSIQSWISELRHALVANGVLVREGADFVFTQDYLFASPSAAAAVALGRSANGRLEWKTQDGRTLKAVQDGAAQG